MNWIQLFRTRNDRVLEAVASFKLEEGKETPFVKIEEKATIFRPVKLNDAPTKFE